MKEDFKLCFKLIKYSYNYKEEKAMSIMFMVIGAIMFVTSLISSSTFIAASLWLVMGPVLYIKSIYSLSYSRMACASGKKKLFELIFPNLWTIGGTFAGYMVMIVLSIIVSVLSPESVAEYARLLIWSSFFHSALLIFMGINNKYFWQSLTFVAVVMIVVMYAEIFWDEGFAGFTSIIPAIAISFLITMGSAGLSCWLRVLTYKKPVIRGKIGKEMLGVQ